MRLCPRVPTACPRCSSWIEYNELEVRPTDGLEVEYGGTCLNCGHWEHSYYLNPVLQSKIDKLKRVPKDSRRFFKHFAFTKDKFDKLQQRLNGTS